MKKNQYIKLYIYEWIILFIHIIKDLSRMYFTKDKKTHILDRHDKTAYIIIITNWQISWILVFMIGWRSLHLSLWHFCWFLWLFHYVVCECFFYSIFSLGNVAFLLLLALRSFYRPHAKLCTPSVSFYSEYELVSSQTLQCLTNFYTKK